jgi:hypothetical protein
MMDVDAFLRDAGLDKAQGAKALLLVAIEHLGEQRVLDCLPICQAIVRIQAEEFGDAASTAHLAEALQYRDRANLDYIAATGNTLDTAGKFPWMSGSHALALRAEGVRRVLDGTAPDYRQLVADHDYSQGKPPFITTDKDVMDFIARRNTEGR